MDNFKAVYKILSQLEKAMDYPEMDLLPLIGPDKLGVSKERWNRYMEMMSDAGYIKGVEISNFVTGEIRVDITDIQVTLKGLEYLQENAVMRRIYHAAKGIKDITPGI